MKDNMIIKVSVAIVSSLLFLTGLGLFIRNVGKSLFGLSSSAGDILFPILLTALAYFILGWFNSKSSLMAFVGAVIALFGGIPLSYLLFAPVTEVIVKTIMPNTNLIHSASLSAIWFVLTPVIIIEIVTDNVIQHKRWNPLFAGIIISLSFMLCIEIVTSNLGQSSRLDIGRLVVYTPVTWCLIVLLVSYGRETKK